MDVSQDAPRTKDPVIAPILATRSIKAKISALLSYLEQRKFASLNDYLEHLMAVSPHRRWVVDDMSRIFHTYYAAIPRAHRAALAKALLNGTSAEVSAASVIALQHVFQLYFDGLSSKVRAHFQFIWVVEKDSSSAGFKQGAREPLSREQFVGKNFLTWKEETALIGAYRAEVLAFFEPAFKGFSASAVLLGVNLSALVLPGTYEADQAQWYNALADGAGGANTVLITCDRDVVLACITRFDSKLATARVWKGAIYVISHQVDVNIGRYNSTARKLNASLEKVKLQSSQTADNNACLGALAELEPEATVRYFFFFSIFFPRIPTATNN